MAQVPSDARTVYIVRHAESRMNVAMETWSLYGMVSERDHGLSAHGVQQCEDLRAKIEQARDLGDADAVAIASRTCTLSSPLCRAVVTGHLALPSVAGPAVVLPDGAERCFVRFFSRDSVGTRRSALAAKVSEELRLLGAARPAPEVDVSAVSEEKWYVIGESAESASERMKSLLRELFARAAGPGSAVFVGHSCVLRQLFEENCSAEFAATETGSGLKTKHLQNCAVLRVSLARESADGEGGEAVRVVDAAFVFGTGLKD